MIVHFLFWGSLFCVFFAYFGYPFSLLLLKSIKQKSLLRDYSPVPVTLIITAFNEEKRIRKKLQNTLALTYPKELLQILVASDGSTDATNGIVRSYEEQGGGTV